MHCRRGLATAVALAAAAAAAAAAACAAPLPLTLNGGRPFPSRPSLAGPLAVRGGAAKEGGGGKEAKGGSGSGSGSSSSSGGGSSSGSGGGKKRRRKKRKARGEDGTDRIKEAMRKSPDAATALGDAIRNNADVLRSDEVPPLHGVDASIASLGLALGTSDPAARRARLLGAAAAAAAGGGEESDESDENDGGGVQASPSAVLAKYFLHSHGGSHGIQSLLSLLSVLAGAGAVAVAPPGGERGGGWAKLVLLRRCLLCAAARHGAGLAAAASLGARRIPAIGWLETRGRMRALALDPVAQYWFYCALLLFWAPVVRVAAPAAAAKGGKEGAAAAAAATATATATTPAAAVAMAVPWWLEGRRTSTRSLLCLLGPILLREVVSTAWVVSDCFVMLTLASSGGDEPTLLRLARGITDAGLSLIFTPSKWRGSDSAARQKMLARLVAKASLALEVLTGAILLYDAIRAFSDYSLSPVGARPSLPSVGKRILCARLYLHFLLVRRKKIRNLVGDIRGGAAQVPGKVLDALLEPKKAMGIKCDGDDAGPAPHGGAGANSSRTLWDYAKMALDF